jgi:hypothetical protein
MKKLAIIYTLVIVGLLALASFHAHAQQVDAKHAQEAHQQPAKPATDAKAPATPAEAPAPALTPAEAQTMQDYDQQLTVLLNQMIPLQQKRAQFVQALSNEHPGFVWHDAKVQGETSGFVKIK